MGIRRTENTFKKTMAMKINGLRGLPGPVNIMISSNPPILLSYRHAFWYQWFNNIETSLSELPVPLIPITRRQNDCVRRRAVGEYPEVLFLHQEAIAEPGARGSVLEKVKLKPWPVAGAG
jgi:hypothetical protein